MNYGVGEDLNKPRKTVLVKRHTFPHTKILKIAVEFSSHIAECKHVTTCETMLAASSSISRSDYYILL